MHCKVQPALDAWPGSSFELPNVRARSTPACRPASANLLSLTGGEQWSKLLIPSSRGCQVLH